MKKRNILFLFITLPFLIASCQQKYGDLEDGVYAEFETNRGTFVAKLYHEATPLTVANFVSLAEGTNGSVESTFTGKRYYDGLTFHRVIKDFMIQGGDPSGNGTGGPGYTFPDEFVDTLQFTGKGQLAMANAGPGTNGSQFFITLRETPHLNNRHTIFGEIVKGQEVVDSIGVTETDGSDKPLDAVIIEKVNIIKKGNAKVPYFTDEMQRLENEKKEREEKISQIAATKAAELKKLEAEADSLDSGVKIHIIRDDAQESPAASEQVLVNYAGYLTNGRLFDTNRLDVAEMYFNVDDMRKASGGYAPMPVEYSMNAPLIPGFKEGMLQMNKGDKATIFIPSHLAYGQRGVPGVIPPDAPLVFELELVK